MSLYGAGDEMDLGGRGGARDDDVAPAESSFLLANPAEGPLLLIVGVTGILLNCLCLAVLRRKKELRLSADYLALLRALSAFDLLYLVTSTPITVVPATFPRLAGEPFLHSLFYPLAHIFMTASIYTIVALATERYLSVREIAAVSVFPVRASIAAIVVFSVAIHSPRFFELGSVLHNSTDQTGATAHVGIVVLPVADFYTVGYFLFYNMVGSFVVTLLVPVVTLSVLNSLIWKRLRDIWQHEGQLGVREKRNMRAAFSLVVVVILFLLSHSMKLVVSAYQIADALSHMDIILLWPHWVESCTFVSHLLLAVGSSVNILLYCSCDKRFFVVVQKTLRSWFVWPLTTSSAGGNRRRSSALANDDDNDRVRVGVGGRQLHNQAGVFEGLNVAAAAETSRSPALGSEAATRPHSALQVILEDEAGDTAATCMPRQAASRIRRQWSLGASSGWRKSSSKERRKRKRSDMSLSLDTASTGI